MSGTERWPIEVNGHLVKRTTPSRPVLNWSGRLQTDRSTAFRCIRCDHEMNPPKTRVEDSRWVRNAFDCVDCSIGTDMDQ